MRTKILADNPHRETQDPEITPGWRCGCCRDTGRISSHYIHQCVDNYHHLISKPFICQKEGCIEGQKYLTAYWMPSEKRKEYSEKSGGSCPDPDWFKKAFDIRLGTKECNQIHEWEVEDWREWAADYTNNSAKAQQILSKINTVGRRL